MGRKWLFESRGNGKTLKTLEKPLQILRIFFPLCEHRHRGVIVGRSWDNGASPRRPSTCRLHRPGWLARYVALASKIPLIYLLFLERRIGSDRRPRACPARRRPLCPLEAFP